MFSRALGHRSPLLWLLLPFIAGLVAGRMADINAVGPLLGIAALAASHAVIASWRDLPPWHWRIAMIVALGCAGTAGGALERQRLSTWDRLPPREVTVSVRVDRTFGQADPNKASGLGRITRSESPLQELAGQRIYFSGALRPGGPTPRRSAILVVTGVVTPLPANPAPASFDGYLASSGVNFKLGRARLLREERAQLGYYRFCDAAAARFNVILGEGIAAKRPALAGLLRAMMLGETRALTEDQHAVFMQSGTMHLFAISGLNIGVIATALQAILGLARIPRWGRFLAGAPLLWLFVDITGGAPSAVRAFAMAIFFQAALVVRRPANPLAALVGSAMIVLLISPLQLFSASFLMSYAIVVALLVLGLPLGDTWVERWRLWPHLPRAEWTRWQRGAEAAWRGIVAAVAIGVATSLVGFLTGIEFFQLLTPGALVSNLVLIPAAMLVTLGGFLSLLSGLLGLTWGAVLWNHASALLLLGIEWFVRISVRVPGTHLAAQFRAGWVGGLALTVLMAALLAGYAWNWRPSRGRWWPPFVIVAITLLVAVRYG